MQSLPIDLHIELSSLRDFINGQIHSGNPYSFNGKELYDILKRVVIDSELKPFLTAPKDESEVNYYEKYQRLSQEKFDKFIPDFFEHEGEFYDLERIQYVYKEFTRPEDFEKLFLIKLLELKANEYPIGEFLYFQQVDNFYGQKESIESFLYQMTANDGNCHLLNEICQELKTWIGTESLALLNSTTMEVEFSEQNDIPNQNSPTQIRWMKQLEALKGKEIESKLKLEQIIHYFSFLYKEKSENGLPFLKKEEVDKIFINGFRMPECDIDPLFKLNLSDKFPVKIIHFAIHQFNKNAGFRRRHKKEYLLFFASFIHDLSKNKYSQKSYESYSKNIYNSNSSLSTIEWSNYLPG